MIDSKVEMAMKANEKKRHWQIDEHANDLSKMSPKQASILNPSIVK